ncbi:MAG: cell division protein FtsZ, partial [Flavobacterium sp.]|nr:cell division protein FtsZ [Flavobacterium sp.]
HVLDDFDIQPTIGKSSSIVTEKKETEEAFQFELKTSISQSEINEIAATSEEVSPMSLTITELQKRAEERRNKMKGFNYKFTDQMNKNIDEIERQPAYKRLGVSLDDTSSTISKSKTSLATDENEDIQLKSNNSFLHDNVD